MCDNMYMSTENICEAVDDEEVECFNCMDNGFTTSEGGLKMPCPDCRTGDLFFYHERDKDLAAMVHVDDDPIQDHALPGYDESDD